MLDEGLDGKGETREGGGEVIKQKRGGERMCGEG